MPPSKKKIIAIKQTPFNHIFIVQEGAIREMWFKGERDYFLQTRLDLDQPNDIPMAYPQLMLSALLLEPLPKRVLIIGLGGGHLPKMMSRLYPETVIDTIEVDPQVVKLAKKFFHYEETSNCRTHVADGRLFIQNQIGKIIYDIVWLDAFKSDSVPYHLKTLQFYKKVQKILKPNGVVGSNLYGRSNKLKPNDRETFLQVFRHCYGFEDSERIATAMLATNREPQWTKEDFLESAKKMKREFPKPMSDTAALYKPRILKGVLGSVFKDDFTQSQLKNLVKKNNLYENPSRLYPVASINFDDNY